MKSFWTKKNKLIFWISLSAILLILALLLVIPPLCDTYNSGVVTKGVRYQGADIGGKTEGEISALLDEEIQKPKEITVLVADTTLSLDLNSAGFSIDKEKTMADIMGAGKNDFFANFAIRWGSQAIPTAVISDEDVFATVVEVLLAQEGFMEQRFDYTVNGDVAEIVLSGDVETYDIERLFEDIKGHYPNIRQEYTLDKKPAQALTAAEIAEGINIPVTNARIDEIDGKKVVIPHQTGLLIDEEALAEMLESGELEFSVPVTVLNPQVYTDDLSADAFPNRLATYSTNYKEWEVDRSSNVKLAAQKVNGTVLNSGDIFSFNDVVGKRTYENGFKDAKIFLADKVVDGTGGGICQVSSTIYPAVLYSDLKIVERRNHNFVVAYAKSGIDATVSYGSIDFKFQNSLSNPIKVKAFAVDGVMTVEIWGTKENNNTVEITTEHLGSIGRGVKYEYNENLAPGETVVTQAGYDGLNVRAYRIVKDENGNVIRTDDLGVSNYIPLVKIIQTSDLGLVETGIPTEIPPEENPEGTEGGEEILDPDSGEGETTEPTTPENTEDPVVTPVPSTPGEESSSVEPSTNPEVTPVPEITPEPTVVPVPEVPEIPEQSAESPVEVPAA
ncbi:MAG: VanW family protein [Clostridia bacterium]|nr:VanW family protein [Clostridia bacterium]